MNLYLDSLSFHVLYYTSACSEKSIKQFYTTATVLLELLQREHKKPNATEV